MLWPQFVGLDFLLKIGMNSGLDGLFPAALTLLVKYLSRGITYAQIPISDFNNWFTWQEVYILLILSYAQYTLSIDQNHRWPELIISNILIEFFQKYGTWGDWLSSFPAKRRKIFFTDLGHIYFHLKRSTHFNKRLQW